MLSVLKRSNTVKPELWFLKISNMSRIYQLKISYFSTSLSQLHLRCNEYKASDVINDNDYNINKKN